MMRGGGGCGLGKKERGSMPFIFGIRKSSKITSAGQGSSNALAPSALAAARSSLRPGCLPSMLLKPARTTGWSSTISSRIGDFVDRFSMKSTLPEEMPDRCGPQPTHQFRRYRRNCLHGRALTKLAADLQFSGNGVSTFSHATNSETRGVRIRHKPLAVVLYQQSQTRFAVKQGNLQRAGVGVAHGVG